MWILLLVLLMENAEIFRSTRSLVIGVLSRDRNRSCIQEDVCDGTSVWHVAGTDPGQKSFVSCLYQLCPSVHPAVVYLCGRIISPRDHSFNRPVLLFGSQFKINAKFSPALLHCVISVPRLATFCCIPQNSRYMFMPVGYIPKMAIFVDDWHLLHIP